MSKPMSPGRPESESGLVVAVMGAECTGKSTLAGQLAAALQGRGIAAVVVPEVLRAFSDRLGRTPLAGEQRAIAELQTQQIAQAAARHPVVIADTTALMTAVYSEQVFGDGGLYAQAERAHRLCALTLVAAPDLPWQSDGHQRDGPAVRLAVDRLLRRALDRSAIAYTTVSGTGAARLQAAWTVVRCAMAALPTDPVGHDLQLGPCAPDTPTAQ
ncbi:ATP-binding protein [Comamonadaceae bacterium G21597-S1]|nr:ATP-binding protein [Comamonadaceae bacterium G21597-S1]